MDFQVEQAKSIFLNAAEIASDEARSDYIDAKCGDNAQLRSEVQSLLRHHGLLGAFLGSSAGGNATIDIPPIAERPGTEIGPYKLIQEIGEGGMGLVFMALQKEPVRHKVALKIIKPGMDTREVIARFEAEEQALAIMDHPNIAKVHDAGATESGRPYFVMELVNSWSITLTGEPMALLADGAAGAVGEAAVLDQTTAQQAVAQALSSWSVNTNVDRLPQINVYVSDLPAGYLGLAWGQSLTLDVSANGVGWFVDATPWDHSEFVGLQTAASQQMDLLTVVSHEIGHLLGAVHSDNAGDLMADMLPQGTRRLPSGVALTTQGSLGPGVGSPLLPEMRMNVTPPNLVDHTTRLSKLSNDPRADNSLWLLPLIGADNVDRPQMSSEAVQAQVFKTLADEEAGLLDEDLLDLIAAGPQ